MRTYILYVRIVLIQTCIHTHTYINTRMFTYMHAYVHMSPGCKKSAHAHA